MIDTQHLPRGPCVVVANHASYLDGVVLKAALPARFSFVIKKEVSHVPLAGFVLRRIGSEFVDRFNRHAGGMDARRLFKAAETGQALAFFPEGTFLAQPGLGKFHTGAFAIATPYRWNLSNLYTTGQVTLTAIPEPSSLVCLLLAALGLTVVRHRSVAAKSHSWQRST